MGISHRGDLGVDGMGQFGRDDLVQFANPQSTVFLGECGQNPYSVTGGQFDGEVPVVRGLIAPTKVGHEGQI